VGLKGWLKARFTKKAAEDDPVKAYDQRLDSLQARATELRRSAATLLAARGELDRSIGAAQEQESQARERLVKAAFKPDVAAVLQADVTRAQERARALSEERGRLEDEAGVLAETVGNIEAEAETLRRERASAQARWTASRTVAAASTRVLVDSLGEMSALDRARDEIERAHALAQICREDLEAKKKQR
jgi:phage shock protein A